MDLVTPDASFVLLNRERKGVRVLAPELSAGNNCANKEAKLYTKPRKCTCPGVVSTSPLTTADEPVDGQSRRHYVQFTSSR